MCNECIQYANTAVLNRQDVDNRQKSARMARTELNTSMGINSLVISENFVGKYLYY